jgi:RecB family exonuclease
VESRRAALDVLPGLERAGRADAFSGRLASAGALERLAAALARPSSRRLSPSGLEAYAACPQAWFFRYLLGLRPPEPPTWELTAAGEGEWVHRTLALFFQPGQVDPAWDADQVARRLEACLDLAREELLAKGQAGHPAVWQARRPVLAQALARVAAGELAGLGAARPVAVEEEFGRGDAPGLAVELDQGPPLMLSGRLDRLDQGPEGLCVTDYKHTADKQALKQGADPARAGRESFQLPVYLAFAQAHWGAPATRGRLVSTRLTGEKARVLEPEPGFAASEPAERARLAAQGRPNLCNLVAELWQRVSRGEFPAQPAKEACRHCRLWTVCRAQAAALPGEAP